MKKMYTMYAEDPFYRDVRSKVGNSRPICWDEIQKGLYAETKLLQVAVINSKDGNINKIDKNGKKGKRFDYDEYEKVGARVIVIGGMVLSRGLTLKGLMISYYSRNAGAYDCLLQMCRWFGYRPGYEDLCRIYLSQENITRFSCVLEAVDDMKRQFKEMACDKKNPGNYGLMIRECPDILETRLLITARNKCRGTETYTYYLNYGGVYADTSKLYKDMDINNENRDALEKLYVDVKFDDEGKALNIPKRYIADCIKRLQISALNKKFDTDGLADYIENHDKFNYWDVLIASGKSSIRYKGKYNAVLRSFVVNSSVDKFIRLGGANNRVMEPNAFRTGLSELEKKSLELRLLKKKNDPDVNKRSNNLSISDYLAEREKPLFIIYPIELVVDDGCKNPEMLNEAKNVFGSGRDESSLVFAFGIGFPKKESEKKFIYRLNKRKQDEIFEEEDNEDDGEGEYEGES